MFVVKVLLLSSLRLLVRARDGKEKQRARVKVLWAGAGENEYCILSIFWVLCVCDLVRFGLTRDHRWIRGRSLNIVNYPISKGSLKLYPTERYLSPTPI